MELDFVKFDRNERISFQKLGEVYAISSLTEIRKFGNLFSTFLSFILYPQCENGIYMYEYVEIGGIKQYVQIRGKDRSNPILLFVHGGPDRCIHLLLIILRLSIVLHYSKQSLVVFLDKV